MVNPQGPFSKKNYLFDFIVPKKLESSPTVASAASITTVASTDNDSDDTTTSSKIALPGKAN